MALVIETGAGITGADSYVSLVDAQAFIDARGLSVTLTEGSLLSAMDHLGAFQFKGRKTLAANPLSFPRYDLYDCEGDLIDSDTVPGGVVAAQIWIAYYTVAGNDPSAISTPAIKMEKVDVIEVEYAVSVGATSAVSIMSMPNVRNALRCLTASAGSIDRA